MSECHSRAQSGPDCPAPYEREAAGSGSVEGVLRGEQAAGDDRLGGVGGAVGDEVELLALGGGEVAEHVVGRVLPARRAADADPYADIVLGADGLADRAQPVVTALAAALLEAYDAERQVELVVHDDDRGRFDPVELPQRGDRAAG